MEFSIQELLYPRVSPSHNVYFDKTQVDITPEYASFFDIPGYTVRVDKWCIVSTFPLQITCSAIEISSQYGSILFETPVTFYKSLRECILIQISNIFVTFPFLDFTEARIIAHIPTLSIAVDCMKTLYSNECVLKDSIGVYNETHIIFKISKKILQ